MVETLPQQVIDKYTMKLPGRAIWIFLALASGVFVVYYFTSRANDVQANMDRKSDLVWLQKILDEKKHRHQQQRPGRLNPFPQYYNLDDYNTDVNDDSVDTNPDTGYWDDTAGPVRTTPRARRRFTESPSRRFPSRLQSGRVKSGSRSGNAYLGGRTKSDRYWTTPSDRRKHVFTNRPRLQPDKEWQYGGDRENLGQTQGRYDKGQNGQSRSSYKQFSGLPDKLIPTDNTKSDYPENTEQNKQFTSTVFDVYTSPSQRKVSLSEPAFLQSTQSDVEIDDNPVTSMTISDSGNTSNYNPVRFDNKEPAGKWPLSQDKKNLKDEQPLIEQAHGGGYSGDVQTSNPPPTAGHVTEMVGYANKNNTRLSQDLFGRQAEKNRFLTKGNTLLDVLKPHSVSSSNKYERIDINLPVDGPERKTDKSEIPTANTTGARDNITDIDAIAERKKLIKYPKYINVFDWNGHPNPETKPECEALQTITSFVRVCIHPVKEDPGASASIKSRSSWEFTNMRDLELAILQDKSCGLIDIGAGIGEYSLAVASFKRHVVAVEPYKPHIDVFQQSVHLSKFEEYITLISNVISDNNDPFSMRHKPGHISDVHFKKATDEQISNNNYTRAITLNQLASVIPFQRAIMKIDIPKFTERALSASDDLFDRVDIRYVFTHWDYKDADTTMFLAHFFKDKGYKPYNQLNGVKLDYTKYRLWKNPYVVWKKMT